MFSSRIGAAPSLSLGHAVGPISTRIDPTRGRPADAVAATLPLNRAANFPNTNNGYNTLPMSSNIRRPSEEGTYGGTRLGSNGLADEFGSTPRQAPTAVPANTVVTSQIATPTHTPSATASNPATVRRPDSSGGGTRLAVTNPQPQDASQSPSRQRTANAAGSGTNARNAQRPWPTAEEEKLRLYEQARAQVAKVQGPDATPVCSLLRNLSWRSFSYCTYT